MSLLFFWSGATALVYEIVWSKALVLMFGSTVQAQTAVLAVFMGGLAFGSRWCGQWSTRVKQPLRGYALLEAGIGLYGLAFLSLHGQADALFRSIGAPFLEKPMALLGLKALFAFALLIVPTVLMGGTLPMIAAWLQKQPNDAGRRSARFYSINSLGAVSGAAVAGFFLVRAAGMKPTLQLAGLSNLLIAVLAWGLARTRDNPIEVATAYCKSRETEDTTLTAATLSRRLRIACVMVALTGAVSMGLQVLSSRLLAMIFGGSLQAFATVVIAFILGIGLGAAAMSRGRNWDVTRATGLLLLLASGWVTLLVFGAEPALEFYRWLRSGVARTDVGYGFQLVLTVGIALVVLGLPAASLGAVLPLWMRQLAPRAADFGPAIGRLLTWNTLGAVVGVLLTGFVLMPNLGLRTSLLVLAGALAVVVQVVACFSHRRVLGIAATAAVLLAAACGHWGGAGWQHAVGSGVFREHTARYDKGRIPWRKQNVEIALYEDAPDATVSVERFRLTNGITELIIRVNGKPDASSIGDLSTQLLCGHLPMLVRPDGRDVFLLGLASGVTGGAVLTHPVERLDVAENCAPMLKAAELFAPYNRAVLRDPRTRVWGEDGRTVLKLSPRQYDVIISEPSNPWIMGNSSVFSREFYEVAASRLKPGGVICQWFQTYEISDELVATLLRTFGQRFPHFEVWEPTKGDLILIGSKQPLPDDLQQRALGFERDTVRDDLARIGITNVALLFARQLASQEVAWAIAGDGPVQSDLEPILEYDAPQAFFRNDVSTLLQQFDERTTLSALAAPAKRALLAQIPTAPLQNLFQRYPPDNEEVRSRLARASATNDAVLLPTPAPTLFLAACPPSPLPATPSTNASWTERLTFAQHLLAAEPARANEALRTMREALSQTNLWMNARGDAARLATLAARAAIGAGDLAQAKELLTLGERIEPQWLPLQHLARWLSREPGAQRVVDW